MSSTKLHPPLVWLDLEMSGLDPDSERIIEIATVITSSDLEKKIEGPNLVINQPQEFIDGMDEWNTNQHGNSGLIDCLKVSKMTESEAEQLTLDFLRKHTQKGKSPLCGNTISHDRRFLVRYMPELVKRWQPELLEGFTKQGNHRALADIYDSIDELNLYRQSFFIRK